MKKRHGGTRERNLALQLLTPTDDIASLSRLKDLLREFSGAARHLAKSAGEFFGRPLDGQNADEAKSALRKAADTVAELLADPRWSKVSESVLRCLDPPRRTLHDVCLVLNSDESDPEEVHDEFTLRLKEFSVQFKGLSDLVGKGLKSLKRAGGYLGLIVDEPNRKMSRYVPNNGKREVTLDSPILWHTFNVFYAAKESNATIDQWRNGYPGEWSARHQATCDLRSRIESLGVTVKARGRCIVELERTSDIS